MHKFHERHASLRRRGVYAFERWKPPAHEALARVVALRDRVHAERTARAAKEAEEAAAWTH